MGNYSEPVWPPLSFNNIAMGTIRNMMGGRKNELQNLWDCHTGGKPGNELSSSLPKYTVCNRPRFEELRVH